MSSVTVLPAQPDGPEPGPGPHLPPPPVKAARTPRARRPAGRPRRVYDAESLLAVSVAEFNTRGYDATSMEDLSRAAGITKSSFYHHVSGKEELLRKALERALDGLFGILAEDGRTRGCRWNVCSTSCTARWRC